MSQTTLRVGAAVLSLVAASACGTADRDVAASSSPTPYDQAISQPYPIAAIARTADPRVVQVELSDLPAASATGACQADVTYQVNEQPLSIGIGVSVNSRLPPPFPGCSTASRSLAVRLQQPLGRRDVVASDRVTPEGGRFTAQGQGYVECRPPGCNPMDEPVVPDCANLRGAVAKTDVPAHFGMHGPCRAPYAALVVDLGAGACSAQEGLNPCAGKRLVRQFWHAGGKDWQLVVQGERSTCADARRALAAFPLGLCRDPQWVRATT
ncbi:MAG: Integral rane protein [Frankiales bacterium]|nr:Integral rane protein [Frankiales bacterium]